MESVLALFNWTDLVSAGASFVLGIGVVIPYVKKARKVGSAVFHLLSELKQDMADDKITSEEIERLVEDARYLLLQIKGA